MSEERFLSTEEVAERLQVDEQTIRRWIKSGKLEAFKPGREWRISPAAFEALQASYSSPKAQAPSGEPEVVRGAAPISAGATLEATGRVVEVPLVLLEDLVLAAEGRADPETAQRAVRQGRELAHATA